MKEKFKGFVKETIPALNAVSAAFAKADIETNLLTITLGKDGYVVVTPDYKLGMEAMRVNAESTYCLKSKEFIE